MLVMRAEIFNGEIRAVPQRLQGFDNDRIQLLCVLARTINKQIEVLWVLTATVELESIATNHKIVNASDVELVEELEFLGWDVKLRIHVAHSDITIRVRRRGV